MLAHVTLKTLFFLPQKDNLIIWQTGPKCKSNFFDCAEVKHTAEKMVRHGDVRCSVCRGMLTVHDCHRRHVIDEEGNRHNGWVAQVHCAVCKCYPSLIPDFILPYKHYESAVIEAAITAEIGDSGSMELNRCPADDSTIRRWVNQFKERGARAVGWLLSILYDMYEKHVSAVELQNRSLLKQLSRLLREFRVPEAGGIFGGVNITLAKHNAGFL